MRVPETLVLEGRWVYNQEHHHFGTCWNGQKLLVPVGDVPAPRIATVEVHARNEGTIPPGYEGFQIAVSLSDRNGALIGSPLGTLHVPASQTHYKAGRLAVQVPAGKDLWLALVWNNDEAGPDVDANIMYSHVLIG